ncbi:ribosome small subunit-dependent GTPase A [Agarivorans sp.]|uniref:ribosome small subunit-dependent GTPase A n=1 Tax=Agarivorans sp. TaxID=1872412 RepID=UPI003D090CD3
MSNCFSLSQLGWKAFFHQQLNLEQLEQGFAARVFAQHRSHYLLATEQGWLELPVSSQQPPITVGDWLWLHNHKGAVRLVKLLERSSLFSRKAAGPSAQQQLIAANVDTAFIVCSLNNDFNLNRIERYLSLATEAQVEAVVVLSKADGCADPQRYVEQVQALKPMLNVLAINALNSEQVQALSAWCKVGQTVAFLGSSGVGKSTLVNSLLGEQRNATGAIREDDSKGRHTTTARALLQMPSAGLLLDTPGMRELQLSDCEQGVKHTFDEISQLAEDCKFADCQHQSEPGCAVQRAISQGQLDPRRLSSYQKLLREQQLNAASIAERRAHQRDLSKLYKRVQQQHNKRQH